MGCVSIYVTRRPFVVSTERLLNLQIGTVHARLKLSRRRLTFHYNVRTSRVKFLRQNRHGPSLSALRQISLKLNIPLATLFSCRDAPAASIFSRAAGGVVSCIIKLSRSRGTRVLTVAGAFTGGPKSDVTRGHQVREGSRR